MKIRRRVEIVTETRRIAVVRRLPQHGLDSSCPVCAAAHRMVTFGEAIELAGVTARTLGQVVQSGRVHFSETAEGHLLVCVDSLVGRLRQTGNDNNNISEECSS